MVEHAQFLRVESVQISQSCYLDLIYPKLAGNSPSFGRSLNYVVYIIRGTVLFFFFVLSDDRVVVVWRKVLVV